ncbi:MAG: hypothetical protein MI919_05385, partial [Holophagales bacterium]|nr:hypothetical protein [Holophagales bacterium]
MSEEPRETATSGRDAGAARAAPDRPWRAAVASGVALGLLVASLEAVKNIPASLFVHYRQPLQVAAVSVLFDLAVAIGVALLVLPLLRFGRVAHAAACALVVGGLILAFPAEMPVFRDLERAMAPAILVLFPLGVRYLSGPLARRVCGLAALLALAVGYGLSYARPAVDWSLGHLRSVPPEGAPNVLLIVLDTVRA